ncbi:beta-1,3-glucan-binding protein 2-like [Teleopsis dalmanni]|uniref:beta-1,3-glucan-binding protein 2-like n=1 Tax=Teleopsis dalmanni TaxID=139649 RepID=UPI0018CEBDF8|nr:beta-1,3-glucan-binding protein 2-like [Teleopsis dalmanni]
MSIKIGLSLVFLCLGLATLCSCNNGEDFQAPSASFMRFEPRGFIVWIPNKPGISLFAFHGNLNQRMNGLEAGNWSVDVLSDEIGFWAYWNDDAVVNLGDRIYFWTFVIKDGLGYRQDNAVFYVNSTCVNSTTY